MPIERLCPVLRAERLNPYAYALTLDGGELAKAAEPGQFVHIACGQSRLLRRPISVCDVAGERLTVVFEIRGEGTAWLARREAGDALDLLGPLGHGFNVSGRRVLVVGGGIGVPPLLYAAKRCAGEVHAVLGFRSADRAMLLGEFQSVCKGVYLCSDDGTLGYHGFVDAMALEAVKDNTFTDILACGPKPMLKSVWRVAQKAGVPCQVSMEERMGCGVGACLVCACKAAGGAMKHVCKDGPVFMAREVDWND